MKTNPDDASFSGIKYNHHLFNTPGYEEHVPGLSKREYFAALAMQELLGHHTPGDAAHIAVYAADQLIKALNEVPNETRT